MEAIEWFLSVRCREATVEGPVVRVDDRDTQAFSRDTINVAEVGQQNTAPRPAPRDPRRAAHHQFLRNTITITSNFQHNLSEVLLPRQGARLGLPFLIRTDSL